MGPGPLCGPALAKLVEGAGAGAGGLSRRGATEQQRTDHGPNRRDTRDDTV